MSPDGPCPLDSTGGGRTKRQGRRVRLWVNLAGSNLGPDWRTVDLTISQPPEWDDERLRQEAARYYAVPIEQVGKVRR